MSSDPYYGEELASIHHRGFGFHAERCAPGILALLAPVAEHDGLVLEIGCGSGLLTQRLIDAGHRVIATDASPAMLALARDQLDGTAELRLLTLPHDPIPPADAIVSVGHALSYLPDRHSVDRSLVALAQALRPGGILALDLCDLEWGRHRRDERAAGWVGVDWALVTRTPFESPDSYIREMTMFTKNPDGSYRRTEERHHNVLVDTSTIPAMLAPVGLTTSVGDAFGSEHLPPGLKTIIGHRA